MKRALAFACLLLLLVCGTVLASEDNWRILIKADDGGGGGGGFSTYVGVGTPTDPNNPMLHIDYAVIDGPAVVSVIPPYPGTYPQNILAPGDPPRAWELRVAGMPNSLGALIRLAFNTATSSTLPPPVVHGIPVSYKMVMVDNKGVVGAPVNGTTWTVPTPTAHSMSAYYTLPAALPMLRLSSRTDAAMLAEGYVMEFRQAVVPEPAGLLALGSGLIGLAGYILRRKA